jgi:putative transposase
MPRVARQIFDGGCYHVINRGNNRATVFHNEGDYFAFVRSIHQACFHVPMRLLGFCVMPNHYHLVLWPKLAAHLSDWMRWLQTAHARRYHRLRGSSGHVWQGRYKSFPIQQGGALNTVLKYVENNPVRVSLAAKAELWPWSSASFWLKAGADRRLLRAFREDGEPTPASPPAWLTEGPVPRPTPWLRYVNAAVVEEELNDLRRSIVKELPFGSQTWVEDICERLGISSRLRPQGRPPLEK